MHVFLCLLIRLVLEGCSCLWVSSARMGRERGGFRWRFSYVLSTAVPSSFVYIGRCGPVVPGCHPFSLSTFVPNTQHYILSTPSTTKTQNQPIQCTSPSPPSPHTTAPTQPSLPPTTNPRSPPAPAPPPRPVPPRQSPRPPQSQSQLQPQEQEASIPPLQARARAVVLACTIRPWDCGM